MICRLCLKDLEDIIDIFDVTGHELNMADIVGKHFWFEPRKDDPISTGICNSCWIKVCEFHEFYEMVVRSHQHMTERFIVKMENCKPKRSTDDLVHLNSLPSKREPVDEFDELSQVPFNMLIEDTTEEATNTIEKAAAIALGADDYGENGDDNQSNDISFDGEAFMKTILTNKTKDEPVNKKRSSNSSKREMRRSTRNANKSQPKPCLNKKPTSNIVRQQRGRPKKEGVIRKDLDDDGQKKSEDSEIYKAKMKEIDNQISQYMSLHCDVCNSATENFAGLRIHMRNEHGIKRGYAKCCNKKFLKRALLLYHIRQHLDPECYRCDDCDRIFADRQSMRNHFLIKHQKEEDKKYECLQCSKRFVRKYLLEQHKMFTHRDRTTTCKICNRRFDSTEELVEHNKEHCKYGTMCDICAKVIRGPAAFKRHQLEHQGIKFPKVQCELCGSWHKDKYALNKHKKRHMESKQPHICEICQKVSPTRSAMLSHKRYVHGTERTYECGVCRKCFKKPLSLREHMTTHTGEVLYRCPHCPKTCNSNANMYSHRKKAHPREFEETRKLRRQNAHLNDQPIPAISVLSNAKAETQALLVIDDEHNGESHNVLITTSNIEEGFNDDEVRNLTDQDAVAVNPIILYSIN